MNLLLSWLILAVSVWAAAAILPGVRVRSFYDSIIVAGVFGLLNILLGWLLFGVIVVGTLGIGYLLAFVTRAIVDAIVLRLTAAATRRIELDGFGWAIACGALMSAIGTAAQYVLLGGAAHAVRV